MLNLKYITILMKIQIPIRKDKVYLYFAIYRILHFPVYSLKVILYCILLIKRQIKATIPVKVINREENAYLSYA